MVAWPMKLVFVALLQQWWLQVLTPTLCSHCCRCFLSPAGGARDGCCAGGCMRSGHGRDLCRELAPQRPHLLHGARPLMHQPAHRGPCGADQHTAHSTCPQGRTALAPCWVWLSDQQLGSRLASCRRQQQLCQQRRACVGGGWRGRVPCAPALCRATAALTGSRPAQLISSASLDGGRARLSTFPGEAGSPPSCITSTFGVLTVCLIQLQRPDWGPGSRGAFEEGF